MSELLDFLFQNVEGFRRARLPSLYSDFATQRTANPDGFAANQSVWLRGLIQASRAGLLPSPGAPRDRLCISIGEDLLQSLDTPDLGRPLALDAVVDQALKSRSFVPYDEFLTSKTSIYAQSWTMQPSWLFSWFIEHVSALGDWGARRSAPSATFVSIVSLEDVGRLLLATLGSKHGRVGRVIPMEMFKTKIADTMHLLTGPSSSDASVLLKYLARDKAAIKYNDQLVVLKDASDHANTISTEEITIATLKTFIAQLEVQVEALSVSISAMSEKAKEAISRSNRNLAMVFLRSRKAKEKTLADRTESLTRLEDVLNSIEQAADQVTMVRIMQDSTKVLQTLQSQVGDVERVQDVVDELKEETQKVEEVGNVMQGAAFKTDDFDDEIEGELVAMLEQTKMQADQKRLEDLNVPKESPPIDDRAVSSAEVSSESTREVVNAS